MRRTDTQLPDFNLRRGSPRSFTRSSLPSRGARLSGHAGRTGRSCTTCFRWRSGTDREKRAKYLAASPRCAPRSSQPDEDPGAAPFQLSMQLHRVVAGVEDDQWGTSSRSGNWLSSPFTCQLRAFRNLDSETRLSRYRELKILVSANGAMSEQSAKTTLGGLFCSFAYRSINLLRSLHIQPC